MAHRHTTKPIGLTIAGLIVLSVALGLPQPAHADAAPPQAPPGSDISTEGYDTNVQMVSEEVIIDVGYYSGPQVVLYEDYDEIVEYEYAPANFVLENGDLYAHVTATFFMQNQGAEEESFDVWYPTGGDDGWYGTATIANFQARVDGLPATTEPTLVFSWDYPFSTWETWPVTFPPGQVVELTVEYDQSPSYYGTFRYFQYILQTGAGWWGPIGEGSLEYHLPFDITAETVEIDSLTWVSGSTATVSGNTINLTFSDLEPTIGDNPSLWVLAPELWEDVQAARAQAASQPDSDDALLDYIQTMEDALTIKYGIAHGDGFTPAIIQSYEKLIELDPTNIDYHIRYIEFLFLWSEPVELPHENLAPALESALAVAPTNERLLEMQSRLEKLESDIARRNTTPTPRPTRLPAPTLTPTSLPSPTLVPSTPTPEPTPQPEPAEATPILPLALLGLTALLVVGALARRPASP